VEARNFEQGHVFEANRREEVVEQDSQEEEADQGGMDMNGIVCEDEPYVSVLKQNFQSSYLKMQEKDKLYLSTGKCVEDELYAFGMQCSCVHQSRCFIIDTTDNNLTKYGSFTKEELTEIDSIHPPNIPLLPTQLRDYINSFNKNTTEDIRTAVFKEQPFDKNYNKVLCSRYGLG
jgi:hypothetical protein